MCTGTPIPMGFRVLQKCIFISFQVLSSPCQELGPPLPGPLPGNRSHLDGAAIWAAPGAPPATPRAPTHPPLREAEPGPALPVDICVSKGPLRETREVGACPQPANYQRNAPSQLIINANEGSAQEVLRPSGADEAAALFWGGVRQSCEQTEGFGEEFPLTAVHMCAGRKDTRRHFKGDWRGAGWRAMLQHGERLHWGNW